MTPEEFLTKHRQFHSIVLDEIGWCPKFLLYNINIPIYFSDCVEGTELRRDMKETSIWINDNCKDPKELYIFQMCQL